MGVRAFAWKTEWSWAFTVGGRLICRGVDGDFRLQVGQPAALPGEGDRLGDVRRRIGEEGDTDTRYLPGVVQARAPAVCLARQQADGGGLAVTPEHGRRAPHLLGELEASSPPM